MNQALNLVVDVVGKGMNRRSEKAIGMADPLTSRTILYEKSPINSIHNCYGPSLYAPVCFVVNLHFLKNVMSIIGRLVVFMRYDHCFVQFLPHNKRRRRLRTDICKGSLVARFGKRLSQLSASHVHTPVLFKVPEGHIRTAGGHAIGKSLEKGIVGGIALGRCSAVHIHFHIRPMDML